MLLKLIVNLFLLKKSKGIEIFFYSMKNKYLNVSVKSTLKK